MSAREQIPQCAATRKTRVAILGDSYCRGLRSFVTQFHNGMNLNLRDCEVHWFANAGGTAKKAIRFDLAAIEHAKPGVCVVQLGGNELDQGEKPGWVAATLCLLAIELKRLGAKVVFICEILPRLNPKFSSKDGFNAAAVSCNVEHLQVVLSPQQHPNVHFWRMRKIWHARERVHAQDGIHLNRRGQGRFYHNIRQAAMAGAKLL